MHHLAAGADQGGLEDFLLQIDRQDAVLDEVGIESSDEEEDEVAKFKEFLDEVSPEDFEAPDEDPPAT